MLKICNLTHFYSMECFVDVKKEGKKQAVLSTMFCQKKLTSWRTMFCQKKKINNVMSKKILKCKIINTSWRTWLAIIVDVLCCNILVGGFGRVRFQSCHLSQTVE
jgi:hypothetical protein